MKSKKKLIDSDNDEISLIPFKAYIRVVKSLNLENRYNTFDSVTVLVEKLIYAKDKKHVKEILIEKYPQFFPDNKIYEKETKDKAQFFYVLIYKLSNYEIDDLNSESWICHGCGQVHENKYIARPKIYSKIGDQYLFCPSNDYYHPEPYDPDNANRCLKLFQGKIGESEFPDDMNYVKVDSLNYIYKVTEKETGRCYIGKTKNEPFFRWWNHLRHSRSPFGVYLRSTTLDKWTFEVLEILPAIYSNSEVLAIESEYIKKYDSIENGFNTLISNKSVLIKEEIDKMEEQ